MCTREGKVEFENMDTRKARCDREEEEGKEEKKRRRRKEEKKKNRRKQASQTNKQDIDSVNAQQEKQPETRSFVVNRSLFFPLPAGVCQRSKVGVGAYVPCGGCAGACTC